MYDFANNTFIKHHLYPDQKKSWVEQILREKAYFEDIRLSLIDRHRVACNRIYQQEFFDADRKKKADQWANDFCEEIEQQGPLLYHH